ncbi:prolactin isoform X1 [Salmo salar]|uniref:Prolactin isoform X1 n=1 Tax=Salmo salar TaxID=8030 RepID=A0ABM3F5B4_SALSA|nr:prolactin-like isoform X1 [Salmo salar]
MSRNNIKQVWALLLVLVCVELCGSGRASAAPICVHGQAGCHFLSLADLFDRVIQHSARMHSISSDLHSEFREELTEVILKLLVAWKDPLWQFHQNMVHQDDFNNFSSNKALEMSYMVHELRKGVEKVADRMQHLGMISNSLSGLSSPEALDPSSDTSGESQAMSDHDLLYCFRRDSNKVQNYLKILKCRIVPENGC